MILEVIRYYFFIFADFPELTCGGNVHSVNNKVPNYPDPVLSGNTASVDRVICEPAAQSNVNGPRMLVLCKAEDSDRTILTFCTFEVLTP